VVELFDDLVAKEVARTARAHGEAADAIIWI
jgi:hypothetical protein